MVTVIELLCVFFWVIPRLLNFICRRFGTLCLFHLHRQVGVYNEIELFESLDLNSSISATFQD